MLTVIGVSLKLKESEPDITMELKYTIKQNKLILVLNGNYIHFRNDAEKQSLLDSIQSKKMKEIIVDGKSLGAWDSSLVVILFKMIQIARHHKIPVSIETLPIGLQRLVNLAFAVDRKPPHPQTKQFGFLEKLGEWYLQTIAAAKKGGLFIATVLGSFKRLFQHRAIMRSVDFLFTLEDCSYRALPIVSLISFMVGLILAFVGAIQLKMFGAQMYVASLVAIGMTRIMGAIMIGVIMAGRTGASYAATIGTMQVNEEVDALKTMGIPISDFLVLPRVLALMITMPFLTVMADIMGMIGGGAVGVLMLDIAPQEYWRLSIEALNMTNFLVGIFHGFVFGIVIALCGCYYGVFCGRNADSVGVATTKAVVSGIVWMIVMTGIITLACEVMGI